jgi:hypothetical protein
VAKRSSSCPWQKVQLFEATGEGGGLPTVTARLVALAADVKTIRQAVPVRSIERSETAIPRSAPMSFRRASCPACRFLPRDAVNSRSHVIRFPSSPKTPTQWSPDRRPATHAFRHPGQVETPKRVGVEQEAACRSALTMSALASYESPAYDDERVDRQRPVFGALGSRSVAGGYPPTCCRAERSSPVSVEVGDVEVVCCIVRT